MCKSAPCNGGRAFIVVPFPWVTKSTSPLSLPFLIKIIRLKISQSSEKVSNIICVTDFIGGAIATTAERADALHAGNAFGVYRLPAKG